MEIIDQIDKYFKPVSVANLGYVAILVIMRYSTFECNSVSRSCLEVSLSAALAVATYFLPAPLQGFTFITAVLSTFYSVLLHKRLVRGYTYRGFDLKGKVYIITGANTGIGYETAKSLLYMNAVVILACRSIDKANDAKKRLLEGVGCSPTKVIVLKLDLCGFDSVRKFVKEFRALGLPLHCLINNAGVMMEGRNLTQDGFEVVFTANHLSHFLLSNLLLPDLEKTKGRIVVVSSALYNMVKVFDFDDVMATKGYTLFGQYSASKFANTVFAVEMQRRLTSKNSSVTCNSLHPGCVMTEVTRNMAWWMRAGDALAYPLFVLLRKTPEQGSYCTVHVATAPELDGVGGRFYSNCLPVPLTPPAADPDVGEKLWKLSAKLVGLPQ